MTDDVVVCPVCGHTDQAASKFCGGCGSPASLAGAPPQASPGAARFVALVASRGRNGEVIGSIVDSLLDDAAALGLQKAEAMTIIERVSADALHTNSDIRCWYDQEQANAGVAGGNTLLALRVENTSSHSIDDVAFHVVHPVTQDVLSLPTVGLLPKSAKRETEVDLAFDRVGRQSLREGFVEVVHLSGKTVCYRFDSAVRVTVEDSRASRTNIRSVSQTIQTHGGGVVSAGGPNAEAMEKAAGERWEEITLVLCDPQRLNAVRQHAAALAASASAAVDALARQAEAAKAPLTPSAPTNLTAMPRSSSAVALQWTDHATNELGFHVERSGDSVAFVHFATTGPDTSAYLVDGLLSGTSYLFRVRAFNDAGVSCYSNAVSVMTMAAPTEPTPPAVAAPVAVSLAPVVHIVNNVTPAAQSAPAPLSDKAAATTSIAKVVMTVVIVIGLIFVALVVGVLKM